MGIALAVLLFLGMLTTIGVRILQSLVDTPDYTGNPDRVAFPTSAGELCRACLQPAAVHITGF